MQLVVTDGEDTGKRMTIDRPVLVGRDRKCDFVLKETRVSRKHFELRPTDELLVLHDLSSNGTRVNGRRVETQITLQDGDVIGVGQVTRMRIEAAAVTGGATTAFETLSLEAVPPRPSLPLEELEGRLSTMMGYLEALQLARAPEELMCALSPSIAGRLEVDRLMLVVGRREGWRRIDRTRDEMEKKWAQTPLSTTVLLQAFDVRQGVLARHGQGELADSASADLATISSVVTVPLLDGDGQVLGALYADRLGESPHLSLDDLRTLAEFALPLARALEAVLLFAKLRHGTDEEQFMGSSEAVTQLRDSLHRVAAVDTPVMLTGPSGSGKLFAARRIHARSSRGLAPFVVVDAATLGGDLGPSELFGHVKGAFTGADAQRDGAFQRAHGGTLLLHRVDELEAEVQALLLRTLESGRVRPVGSDQEVEVDVRVLSTATADMEVLVADKTFRQDLLYRLRVIEVPVPGLDERREDIPELALAFVEAICARQGRARPRFEPGALESLAAMDWPGGARELRNVLERRLVLEGDLLRASSSVGEEDKPGRLKLDDIVQDHILYVLDLAGGNKSRAADLLGIDRSTLYARLRQGEST